MDKRSELFKIISDETRLSILDNMSPYKEKSVGEIQLLTGKSQPLISANLKKMKDLGLISSRREGKKILYSIKSRMILRILSLFKHKKRKHASKK